MDKTQLLEAIEKLPNNPIEWDTAILTKKLKPILLALIDQVPNTIEVNDIEALTKEQLDALRPGDMAVKITGKQKHTYIVTYKGDGAGEGIVLTYNACGYGEAISYDRTDNGWAFNSKDVKTYGD